MRRQLPLPLREVALLHHVPVAHAASQGDARTEREVGRPRVEVRAVGGLDDAATVEVEPSVAGDRDVPGDGGARAVGVIGGAGGGEGQLGREGRLSVGRGDEAGQDDSGHRANDGNAPSACESHGTPFRAIQPENASRVSRVAESVPRRRAPAGTPQAALRLTNCIECQLVTEDQKEHADGRTS